MLHKTYTECRYKFYKNKCDFTYTQLYSPVFYEPEVDSKEPKRFGDSVI